MKKKLLLFFLAIGAWTGVMSQDVGYVMRVNLVNGTVDEYLVERRLYVSFWEDTVHVASEGYMDGYEYVSGKLFAEYLSEEIESYTFLEASATDIKDFPQEDKNVNMSVKYTDGENVIIRNIGANASISVFSTDGKMQKAVISRTEDGADVSLSTLPTGIYIINIKNKSIKVLKK